MSVFSIFGEKDNPKADYESMWKQYSGWIGEATSDYERAKSVQQAKMAQSGMEFGSEQWNRMLDYETRDYRNRVKDIQGGATAKSLKDYFGRKKKDKVSETTPITQDVQGPGGTKVTLQGNQPPSSSYNKWSNRDLIEAGFSYSSKTNSWVEPQPESRYAAESDVKYDNTSWKQDPKFVKNISQGEKLMPQGKSFEQYFAGRWGLPGGDLTQEEIRRLGSTSTFSIFK